MRSFSGQVGAGLGGGLGGSLGGTLDTATRGSIGSSIERTTRTVRGTVDGTASTQGSQSVDARRGTVQADRSAQGSLTGSTASLTDLAVPPLGGMTQASGSGSDNANAQLIGTDALAGTLTPAADQARSLGGSVAGAATGTANGMIANAPLADLPPMPAMGAASGEGSGAVMGEGALALTRPALAVAGTAAAFGEGAATVAPGMPVMPPDGASLGRVREVIANGCGEVEQVVVQQGNVTRALPAGMFNASGDVLFAGQAQGNAQAADTGAAPAESAIAE